MPSTERAATGLVSDVVAGQTSIEGAVTALPKIERIAVLASYSATPAVSQTVTASIRELQACGYFVILVRASDSREALEWPNEAPADVLVIRKPNIGYDFGSTFLAIHLLVLKQMIQPVQDHSCFSL